MAKFRNWKNEVFRIAMSGRRFDHHIDCTGDGKDKIRIVKGETIIERRPRCACGAAQDNRVLDRIAEGLKVGLTDE